MSASEVHRDNTSSTNSMTVKSALKAAARRYKEHHRSVNAAFVAYYGYPTSPSSSTAPTRRASAESTSTVESNPKAASPAVAAVEPAERRPRNITRAWNAIKEHHKDLNNAYAVYYGAGN